MFTRPLHCDDENTIYLLDGNVRMNVEYAISSLKGIVTKPLYDKTIFENKFFLLLFPFAEFINCMLIFER